MRTRRSPRNQDILWRSLGGPIPMPARVDDVAMLTRFLADPFISPRARRKAERDLIKAKQREAMRIALNGQ